GSSRTLQGLSPRPRYRRRARGASGGPAAGSFLPVENM
ncbi:MAG: hypothetical protein AVDCRST_MAG37-2739, partial [uncultured Rubrobacteraceae bacterium]